MRRRTTVALGLVAVITLLTLVLAVPAAADRDDLLDWRGNAQTGQVTIDEAGTAAAGWLNDNGYTDLVVAESVDIDGRYSVIVNDAEGNGTFELFVSPDGSSVHPAPTMMWNTAYDLMTAMMADMPAGAMPRGGMGSGMMNGDHQHTQHGSTTGGMMDRGEMTGMMDQDRTMNAAHGQDMTGAPAADPLAEPLTADAAATAAQAWLDANQAGAAATDPVAFPGYVTLRVSSDGAVNSLIAVQLTTGAVWLFN